MKKSFCFVLNPLEVTGQIPIELIPGHFLQRADAEQTNLIREQLHRHYARHYPFPAYEYEWLEEVKDDKGGSSRGSRELSADRYRYFAVIESLVTHDPKDDFDSLNHQISTKMTLLSKRFDRKLDYYSHFGLLDFEKVWKKLYGYRSALAHGTPADFKTKFQILKDPAIALNFLKEATKLTLLFAMKEPEFLADLKKC